MAAMSMVVLLAIASTCQGAPKAMLQEVRMEEGGQRLYKSVDLLGLFMGLKYKTANDQPGKGKIGRNFQLVIDDLKKYVKQAHSNKVVLDIGFWRSSDGDGIFRLDIHYSLEHSDGEGEEKGSLRFERDYQNDDESAEKLWTTTLQITAGAFTGKTIIPTAINNIKVKLKSDRKTKFHAEYYNLNTNRFIGVDIDRVPGKSAHVVITFDLRYDDVAYKKVLQIDTKIKQNLADKSFEARTKYDIFGGIIVGEVLMKLANNVLTLKIEMEFDEEFDSIELIVKVALGESLYIEGKKKGESMWTYNTKGTTKRTGDVFELTLNTEMTLSEKSEVSKFLTEKYPYGAFKTIGNKIHIFIDKKNLNKLAPKFKVDVQLQKDGANVVDLTADTTVSPYVSLLVKEGGVQMLKVTLSTEKYNNANEFKFILHDRIEINPGTELYRNTISHWMDPPYSTRSGEFEFYANKVDKNVLLNKFYVKGKVMKDDAATALTLLVSTNEQPYKFELFCPYIFDKVKPGFHELKIAVAHNPGQSLEIKTNFNGWKSYKNGLKIYKTGSGNERKVEVDDKEIVMGDYTLSDNSFSTKLTVGGNYLEHKITWEGKLPQNKAEAEAFMLKNNIVVKVSGSKRNLDLSLNWKMTKPDFNFGTPENGKISLNAKGNNPRWGDYSLSRDANWKVENKVIEVHWTGLAQFAQGRLATATPIETAFNFKVLLDKADLIGKFMKKVNGKEYSIDFPKGSGVMPKIVMGQ